MNARYAVIEAMARAMGQLWAGAFDQSGQYSGQSAERNVWLVHATTALDALFAALPALGLRVVPVEATREMNIAVDSLDWSSQTDLDWHDGYRAMIAAAPDMLGRGG